MPGRAEQPDRTNRCRHKFTRGSPIWHRPRRAVLKLSHYGLMNVGGYLSTERGCETDRFMSLQPNRFPVHTIAIPSRQSAYSSEFTVQRSSPATTPDLIRPWPYLSACIRRVAFFSRRPSVAPGRYRSRNAASHLRSMTKPSLTTGHIPFPLDGSPGLYSPRMSLNSPCARSLPVSLIDHVSSEQPHLLLLISDLLRSSTPHR
jgi:hypothetical protein